MCVHESKFCLFLFKDGENKVIFSFCDWCLIPFDSKAEYFTGPRKDFHRMEVAANI